MDYNRLRFIFFALDMLTIYIYFQPLDFTGKLDDRGHGELDYLFKNFLKKTMSSVT